MDRKATNQRSMLGSFRVEEDFTNRQIVRVVIAASVYVVFATFMLCLFFTYNVNPVMNPSIGTAQLSEPSLLAFPGDFMSQWEASEQMRGALKVWLTGTVGMTAIFAVALGMVVSRKLAGPIYHLKKDMQQILDGGEIRPITLRTGDELMDVAALINETLPVIEKRHVDRCSNGSNPMASEETMANIAAMRSHLRALPATAEQSDEMIVWARGMSDLLEKVESSEPS